MLWASADMREAKHFEQFGDCPLAVIDIEAILDYLLKIDPAPADNTINCWIWTCLDDLSKFDHLRIAEVSCAARSFAIHQIFRPRLVETMNPIPKGLAVHPANLRCLRPIHAIIDRRQG